VPNLYIQASAGLVHSAPLPGRVKTRVFRDCRAKQKRASGLPPWISRRFCRRRQNPPQTPVYGGKHLSKTRPTRLDGQFGV